MGLPSWNRVWFWISPFFVPVKPKLIECEKKERKHKDILIVEDYSGKFPDEFWKKFPYREIPSGPESCVNHAALKNLIKGNEGGGLHQRWGS